MLGRDVVVHLVVGEVAAVQAVRLVVVIDTGIVAVGVDAGLQVANTGQLTDLLEGRQDDRVRCCGEGPGGVRERAVGAGRNVVQVHGAHNIVGALVREQAVDGVGRQHLACEVVGVGQPVGLKIGEKEELVLLDGSADVPAELVEVDDVPRLAVDSVEVVVGVEKRVPVLPEHAAVEVVGTGAGGEADVRRTLATARSVGRRGAQGDFLDRVDGRVDVAEEAVAALEQVVLRVHAVNGDVERTLGQTVDGRTARIGGSRYAGLGDHQFDRIAGGKRDLGNLAGLDGAGEGGRFGLENFRSGFDHDALGGGTDFQLDVDGGGNAGVDHDVVNGRLLETRLGHGHLVGGRRQGGQSPFPATTGGRLVFGADRGIGDGYIGSRNDAALRVCDHARHDACRALRICRGHGQGQKY